MRKIDEKRGREASSMWRAICTSLSRIFSKASIEPPITYRSMALECIESLTGTRHGRLHKRLAELDPEGLFGMFGEHQFKAMRDIRLRKAMLLLTSIYEYLEVVCKTPMAMTRIQCLVPSILRYFMIGGEQIQEYEDENRAKMYFPGIGVRVIITDGSKYVLAEVVPDYLVQMNVDSHQALLVISGPLKGAVVTPKYLGKLYRLLFPEYDKKVFARAKHYFWQSGAMPSSYSEKAKEAALNTWSVAGCDKTIPAVYPGSYGTLTETLKKKFRNPLKFIHKDDVPSWQNQESFEAILNKKYAEVTILSEEEEPIHPEPMEMPDLPPPPEPETLTLVGPLPSSYAEFVAEYRGCQRYLSKRWSDLQDFTVLSQKVEKARRELAELERQLDGSSLQPGERRVLKQMALRWENLYACIPHVTSDMDERNTVIGMIDSILRPLVGDNAVIFESLEEPNGEETT